MKNSALLVLMMLAISCASDGSRQAEQATDSTDVNLVLQNSRNRGQVTAAIVSTTVLALSQYFHLIEDKILLIMAIVGVGASAALIQDTCCVRKQDKLCTSRFERLKAHVVGASLSILPLLVAIMTSNTNRVKVSQPPVRTNVQTSDQTPTTTPSKSFHLMDGILNAFSKWWTDLSTNNSPEDRFDAIGLDGSESMV